MGLVQGSGSAPPAFCVLSGIIVNAYKRLRHGSVLTSAYMARLFVLAAVMYVNDTDLLHLTPDPTTTDEEVIELVQEHQTD